MEVRQFANTLLDGDDVERLQEMMRQDGYTNRSAWIRWLIRREWTKRVDAGLVKGEATPTVAEKK